MQILIRRGLKFAYFSFRIILFMFVLFTECDFVHPKFDFLNTSHLGLCFKFLEDGILRVFASCENQFPEELIGHVESCTMLWIGWQWSQAMALKHCFEIIILVFRMLESITRFDRYRLNLHYTAQRCGMRVFSSPEHPFVLVTWSATTF